MKTLTISLLMGLLSISSAQAAIVNGDWLQYGDNLANLDTETGIEWLKIKETSALSIADVKSMLDGKYAGWRLPNEEEVVTFFNHLLPQKPAVAGSYIAGDRDSIASDYNYALAKLSNSHSSFTNGWWGYNSANYYLGLHQGNDGKLFYSGVHTETSPNQGFSRYYLANEINGDENYSNIEFSVFLVSDGGATISSKDDPERNAINPNSPYNVPFSGALFGIGLAFMGLSSRKA